MSDDRTTERSARAWLELGPTQAPDHAVEAALRTIDTTSQERDLRIPWRFPTVNPLARVAVLITVAIFAIGAGLYLTRPDNSKVGTEPSPSSTILQSAPAAVQSTRQVAPIADGTYVGRAVKISDIIASINSTSWLSASERDNLLTAPFAQPGKSTFNAYFELNNGAYAIGFIVDGVSEVDMRATSTFPDDHTLLLQENVLGGPLQTRIGITVEGDSVNVTLLSHETPNNSATDRFIGELLYGSGPFRTLSSVGNAACNLITTDEARNSTDNPGLGATIGPLGVGAVSTCIYSTGGGDITLRLTYTKPGGRAAFETLSAKAGVRTVAGIGTEAVYDPAAETMYVVKGDSLVAVLSGMFVTDKLAAETQLAKLIAGRI
jgi:hypothetical protein